MGAPKYKAGDKVKLIDHRRDHWNSEGQMDKFFGAVITLDHNSTTTWCGENEYQYFDPDTKATWYFLETDFVCKVEDEPTYKYKVGDKVKIIANNGCVTGKDKYIGCIVTIKRIDPTSNLRYAVKENEFLWRENDLVLVREDKDTIWKVIDEDVKETLRMFIDEEPMFMPKPFDTTNAKITCKEVPATWSVVVYQKECNNCGTHSEYDAKFCRKCGKPLVW